MRTVVWSWLLPGTQNLVLMCLLLISAHCPPLLGVLGASGQNHRKCELGTWEEACGLWKVSRIRKTGCVLPSSSYWGVLVSLKVVHTSAYLFMLLATLERCTDVTGQKCKRTGFFNLKYTNLKKGGVKRL